MTSFPESMHEYCRQVQRGTIVVAYRGLMDYIHGLRQHFASVYPTFAAGGIYHGYMDMTYFPLFPPSLKQRKLKVAVVFLHKECRFEVWLVGFNKTIQRTYWTLFKASPCDLYRIPDNLKGIDSIVECVVASDPDFHDVAQLTKQIEGGTVSFISAIEDFITHRT